jgi:hypothetical protein
MARPRQSKGDDDMQATAARRSRATSTAPYWPDLSDDEYHGQSTYPTRP